MPPARSAGGVKLLRAAEHRRMPWKNGRGETVEVAVSRLEAGRESFDWRVSMAVVASDGPFSVFPGIDRTIVLLDGDGMMLAIAGRAPVMLTPGSAPCAFAGEVGTTATLVGGAVTGLNVMTARGRYIHAVERFAGRRDMRAGASETLLLLGDGATAGGATLRPHDVARLDPGDAAIVRPATTCLRMSIRAID